MALDPAERLLGQLVLQQALLSREQVIDCARRAQEDGRRNLAEVARDLGWLAPSDVEALIWRRDQMLAQRRAAPVDELDEPTPQSSVVSSPVIREAPPITRTSSPGFASPARPSSPHVSSPGFASPAPSSPHVSSPGFASPAPSSPFTTPSPSPVARYSQTAQNGAVELDESQGAAISAEAPMQAAPRRPSLPPTPSAPPLHAARHFVPRSSILTRTVSEPNVDDTTKAPYLYRALRFAIQHGASDLHFHSGVSLMARAAGRLLPFQGHKALGPEAVEKAIAQILTDEQWEKLMTDGEVDFALELPRLGRFRGNAYRQHRGMDAVFRILPPDPPRLDQLGLPESLARLVEFRTGLVLCTGPAGSGKSTTLAALLNVVIASRKDHVLTIENPVEFVYRRGQSVVTQRQVGAHTTSFARALRAALREDPDVIAITELRDRDTMSLAMTAAETGHLVVGTLNTGNAGQTIGRIINAFPAEEQGQVRATLSESLRAVVSQRLVPRADGNGRAVALEVLIVNTAVANLIREEKEYQVAAVMQTGKALGMLTLDDSLSELLTAGTIDKTQARRFADNKERFK